MDERMPRPSTELLNKVKHRLYHDVKRLTALTTTSDVADIAWGKLWIEKFAKKLANGEQSDQVRAKLNQLRRHVSRDGYELNGERVLHGYGWWGKLLHFGAKEGSSPVFHGLTGNDEYGRLILN